MLRLDTTTRTLQIQLSGAVTTNQLPVLVAYSDKAATTYDGNSQASTTNDTTAVSICDAPAASVVRDIDYLSVWNRDTVSQIVSIIFDDNGTPYTLLRITLTIGEQLVYTHAEGWSSNDTNGRRKVEIISTPGTAYVNMTDGTNTSIAVGADTFRFRSANDRLAVLVGDDDVTFGDNLLLTLDEGNIVHNNLSGLQGGTAGEFYHLTLPEDTTVVNLTALANGIVVKTGANTFANRTLTQPAAGITISNADGVAGNPTFALANDLAALEGLGSTGIAVRTAADTWVQRTITGTTNQITLTDGDGVAGNPIIAIASNTILPGTESATVPMGTTAERPVTPLPGMIRYNTDINCYEAWSEDAIAWQCIDTSVEGNAVKQLISGQLAHQSGTTLIPFDNTPPLVTEGTQFFTQNITTETAGGRVVIWFSTIVTVSNANRVATIALFRDSVLIGVTAVGAPSTNSPVTATFIVADSPGAAGTYAYSGRIGVSAAATWYVGGFTPDANYGGQANTNNQYVALRIE